MCYQLTTKQEEEILEVAYAVDNEKLEGGTYYRYVGSPTPQRTFCRVLMALNKLYTKADINLMSFRGDNSKFAKKGQNKYSIFKYRGGANCKHYWEEILVVFENGLPKEYSKGVVDTTSVERLNFKNETMDIFELVLDDDNIDGVYGVSLVAEPAMDIEGIFFNSNENLKELPIKWQLSNEEKRIIVAPVLIPNKKIFRNSIGANKQKGLTFVSEETIEKLQQNFFKQKYHHNSTIEHNEAISGVYFFESWIISDPMNDKSNTLGFKDLPKGTWMMAMKVDDIMIWEEFVKTGVVKGLSIDALLRPVKQEELNTIKLKKMNKKTISEIVKMTIQKVAMSADLVPFKLEDGKELQSSNMDLESVVTDMDGNAYADMSFTFEGFDYKTDENGVIIAKDAVVVEEVVEMNENLMSVMSVDDVEYFIDGDSIAEGVAIYADNVMTVLEDGTYILKDATVEVVDSLILTVSPNEVEEVEELVDETIALKETIVKLEEEIAKLKADNVLKENEVVMMKKNRPASSGIVDRPVNVEYSKHKGNESVNEALKRLIKLNKNK